MIGTIEPAPPPDAPPAGVTLPRSLKVAWIITKWTLIAFLAVIGLAAAVTHKLMQYEHGRRH